MQDPNELYFIVSKLDVLTIGNPIALAIYIFYKASYASGYQIDGSIIKEHFKINENQYREAISYLKARGIE